VQPIDYLQLLALALKFAITHQIENPQEFSEIDENKQLHIAIVVCFY